MSRGRYMLIDEMRGWTIVERKPPHRRIAHVYSRRIARILRDSLNVNTSPNRSGNCEPENSPLCREERASPPLREPKLLGQL